MPLLWPPNKVLADFLGDFNACSGGGGGGGFNLPWQEFESEEVESYVDADKAI